MIKLFKIQNSKFKIKDSRFINNQSSIFNFQSSMSKGLTLIEVMIVVAILAIISSTLFSVFQGSLFSQRKGTSKALVYSETRAALDMMSKEIEKAMVDERIGAECLGLDGTGDFPDTFLFIAPLNPDKEKDTNDINNSELCEVGYWVEGNELKKGWTTGASNFKFFDDITKKKDFENENALIGNVSNLQFEYFYFDKSAFPPEWKWSPDGRWDEFTVYVGGTSGFPVDALPRAIKITLVMEYEQEKDEIKQDTFITVVNIPGSGQ